MKTLIALSMLLIAGSVSAQVHALGHYQAQFEITDISSSCPEDVMCITAGQVVTMTAEIDCTDQVVYKSFDVVREKNQNIIHATAVVRRGLKTKSIRCVAPQVITEKVTVWNWNPVSLINTELE